MTCHVCGAVSVLQDAQGRGWCALCQRAELTRVLALAAVAHENLEACGWADIARLVRSRIALLDKETVPDARVPFDLGAEIEQEH